MLVLLPSHRFKNHYSFFDVSVSRFKRDISRWDVSKVRSFAYAFNRARSFSSDLSAWNVSAARSMYAMFYDADFNADLSAWDVSRASDLSFVFWSKCIAISY